MPQTKAQRDGLKYEVKFASRFGVKPTAGSGNQWFAKLDVGAHRILCSLKHTGKKSLSVTPAILREAIQEATKIGSKGAIPVVGTDISGEDFVILRADDFALLLEEEVKIAKVSRAKLKRARASIPEVLRAPQHDNDADE